MKVLGEPLRFYSASRATLSWGLPFPTAHNYNVPHHGLTSLLGVLTAQSRILRFLTLDVPENYYVRYGAPPDVDDTPDNIINQDAPEFAAMAPIAKSLLLLLLLLLPLINTRTIEATSNDSHHQLRSSFMSPV